MARKRNSKEKKHSESNKGSVMSGDNSSVSKRHRKVKKAAKHRL